MYSLYLKDEECEIIIWAHYLTAILIGWIGGRRYLLKVGSYLIAFISPMYAKKQKKKIVIKSLN